LEEELAMLIESVEPFPNRFIPFFHVDPKTTSDLTPPRIEEILAVTGDFVSFQGYGETAFYRHPWLCTNLTDPPWPEALAAMEENNLVVMIHLTSAQLPGFKAMLIERPGLTVLLHGPELVNELPELLKEHLNLYYTLDTATTMFLDGPHPHPLMYPRSGGRTEFLAEYRANRDTMLQSALSTWNPVLEAAPDRVMWGTDVSMGWHADAQVYEALMEFSNIFLENLPSALARSYAFDNALRLFGAGMVVDPTSLDLLLGEDSETDR
jgi:hypothetical protein